MRQEEREEGGGKGCEGRAGKTKKGRIKGVLNLGGGDGKRK